MRDVASRHGQRKQHGTGESEIDSSLESRLKAVRLAFEQRPESFLTIAQIADRLHISRKGTRKLLHWANVPHVRRPGGNAATLHDLDFLLAAIARRGTR